MNINLGSGRKWRKYGWTNADKIEDPNVDVHVDFEESSWPFESESADLIFCSHVLEHLSDKAMRRLLKNIYRTLKPGGAVRIIVPDFGKAMERYTAKDIGWFSHPMVTGEISLQGNSMPRRFLCFAIRYKQGDYVGGPNVSNADIEENFKRGPDEFLRWAKSLIPKDAEPDHKNAFWKERLTNELQGAGFTVMQLDARFSYSDFVSRPTISLVVDATKSYQ